MRRDSLERWERLIYVAVLILAVVTRFYMLGDRSISHDESIHTKFSWNLYAGQGFQHNPMMHGPLLFEVTAFVYWLFGATDFTSRVYVAVTGVILVMTPLLFRRWLGRSGALVTAGLLLISPSISYYSRYIRHDASLMLTAVLLLWCMLRYVDSGRRTWLVWSATAFALMHSTKEASYIYTAIYGVLLLVPFAVWVLVTRWERRVFYRRFVGLIVAGLVLAAVFAAALGGGQVTELALDDAGNSRVTDVAVPGWGRAAAVGSLTALAGALLVLRPGIGRQVLARSRLFDLLMVIGTLTLPLGSALLIKFAAGVDMNVVYEAVRTGNFAAVPASTVIVLFGVLVATIVASIVFGLWWDRRAWPVVALTHYAIFIVLYTTVFTWGFGALSGLVGGLAYWLAQHGVKRGDQPSYYYLLIGGLYEYLAVLLSIGGGVAAIRAAVAAIRRPAVADKGPVQDGLDGDDVGRRLAVGFPLFLLGWTALSWIGYGIAGEKMPWLVVHIALPSIYLGGWGFGRFLDGEASRARRWMPLVALMVSAVVALGAFVVSVSNYEAARGALESGVAAAGLSLDQIRPMWAFVGGVLGLLCAGTAAAWAWRRVGSRSALWALALVCIVGLAGATVRTMTRVNYVTYDLATEFLVYAHGTPDIKTALAQVREVSWRETGTPSDVRVAYGEDGSWPFTWYMVEFSNNYFYSMMPSADQLLACPVVIAGSPQYGVVEEILGDDYIAFDYHYLWWPIQDYFGMTPARISGALRDPAMRAALWDIVWRADYEAYARLKNPTSPFSLQTWPYRKDFRLYVRRETAARTWPTAPGAAGAVYSKPVATAPPDPYASGVRALVQESESLLPGAVVRGIAAAADGSLYLADTLNHRIWHVEASGDVTSFGGYGAEAGQLNEPWDVAVDAEGAIYVADTWNHRVQKFDPDQRPVLSWGGLVQVTVTGLPTAQGKFYGPRGLAISPGGELFVADTGNKRVQVFDLDGTFLREFGGGGTAAGYLDEPVGIDVSADGVVAVVDSWNRRVQLFTELGEPLRQWSVPTWDTSNPDEKPFLAWGDADSRLYVADPLRRRVLAFGADGAFQWALITAGGVQLGFPQGLLAVGDTLFVADAHAGAVYGVQLPR
ncbi:MAG: TIGR03663 family protein [Anaerolineae bacterium]|nr:TIGR03663 family protein [Anaerolineae bacterium]